MCKNRSSQYNIFPKDNAICRLEVSGMGPPTFQLVDDRPYPWVTAAIHIHIGDCSRGSSDCLLIGRSVVSSGSCSLHAKLYLGKTLNPKYSESHPVNKSEQCQFLQVKLAYTNTYSAPFWFQSPWLIEFCELVSSQVLMSFCWFGWKTFISWIECFNSTYTWLMSHISCGFPVRSNVKIHKEHHFVIETALWIFVKTFTKIWDSTVQVRYELPHLFIFLHPGPRTLLPVPVCFSQREWEGQRWQKEDSYDLLWHSDT